MDSLFDNQAAKLRDYQIETLRNYCRKLGLTTHGYRQAIEERLVEFLNRPQGRLVAMETLDSIFL